ncbi:MAG TPA: hypothetical protein VJ954_09570 [Ignavibacteriaceae bacterium]|nr:hypothetical protein [Ignavibacteriaceae bacterium]
MIRNGIEVVRFYEKNVGSNMSAHTGLRKITDWVKNYNVLLFIGFISLGWLASWLIFVIFALLFVN